MGRPESPLDPAAGPVEAFAYDLRELRRAAGGAASYRSLARVTHYSVTTLSQAAAGRALPTLPVLLAFVGACDGDRAAWEGRWRALAQRLDAERTPADAGAVADAAPALARRPGRWPARRTGAVLAVAAALLVGAVAGIVVPRMTAGRDRPPPARPSGSGAVDPVADGSDPNRAGCGPDAVTLGRVNVHFPADALAGRLELRYSPRCRAAWSRFTPDTGWRPGSGVVVTVWTIRPADQATQYYSVPYAGEAIIGNMLMTAAGCVAAEVSMAQGSVASPVATTQCEVFRPTAAATG